MYYKLISINKDLIDRETLQKILDSLVNWADKWKMCFNEKKCKFMVFGTSSRYDPNEAFSCGPILNPNWEVDLQNRHPKLIMLDENNLKHILEESTCERDLGVLIDNRLRWQPQINIAKSKAYASLGSLKRAIKHWTPSIFKILYIAFVRPHLEFCSSVSWDSD